MSRVILLGCTLLFGLVFLAIPDSYNHLVVSFPFSPMKLTFQTWVYFISEGLIKIILAYLLWAEAKKYKFVFFVFLWIQVFDLVDYLLSYNSIWFEVGQGPVSMNTVSIVIFAWAVLKEFINER